MFKIQQHEMKPTNSEFNGGEFYFIGDPPIPSVGNPNTAANIDNCKGHKFKRTL